MLVRRVQPTAVQRAYPFLRTERTHGLSSRICKHQFSDWTSLQVKGSLCPNTHTNCNLCLLWRLNVVHEPPRLLFLVLFRWFLAEKGFNAKALAVRLTPANWLPTVLWLANASLPCRPTRQCYLQWTFWWLKMSRFLVVLSLCLPRCQAGCNECVLVLRSEVYSRPGITCVSYFSLANS